MLSHSTCSCQLGHRFWHLLLSHVRFCCLNAAAAASCCACWIAAGSTATLTLQSTAVVKPTVMLGSGLSSRCPRVGEGTPAQPSSSSPSKSAFSPRPGDDHRFFYCFPNIQLCWWAIRVSWGFSECRQVWGFGLPMGLRIGLVGRVLASRRQTPMDLDSSRGWFDVSVVAWDS